jgi:hypothetical protein
LGTTVQVVPVVGQSLGAVQTPLCASQRQTARQVCSHRNPGAHSAAVVQGAFSFPVRVGAGQLQSTWSMLDGITQARPEGHPVRFAVAAAAVGSQLNVQVRKAPPQVMGSRQKLPGPTPPSPKAAQSLSVAQNCKQSWVGHPSVL